MTGYETLWFFGRIRGMPSDFLDKRVKSLISRVGLSAHADKPCGTYSGGNKRKLSLAVALIGDPMVLFLDEVSIERCDMSLYWKLFCLFTAFYWNGSYGEKANVGSYNCRI